MTKTAATKPVTPLPFHIPSLDGLRAVSIMIVFVAHAGVKAFPGGFGVTVFFFLSGYLITTLLRREFDTHGRIHYREFYWRRLWRIFPPMYAALALGIVASLTGLTTGDLTATAITAQAAHLTNYAQIVGLGGGMPLGTGVFWSLAVEEHFYLVFPVCAAGLMRHFRPSWQALALLFTCALILMWRIFLVVGLDASADRTFAGTDTRLDAILFGCAMALYFNPSLDAMPRPSAIVALATAAAAGAVIVGTMVVRNDVFRETIRYTIQSIALAPLFFVAIQRPDLWPFRILNHRWVAFVGVLSYSLYLVHHIVIFAVLRQMPSANTPTLILISGAISFAIAYAFHRLIEKPAAVMRKRHAAPTTRKATNQTVSFQSGPDQAQSA